MISKGSINMLFMLQMVTTQPEAGASGSVTPEEGGKTLSKLWQLGNIIATGNGEFSFYLRCFSSWRLRITPQAIIIVKSNLMFIHNIIHDKKNKIIKRKFNIQNLIYADFWKIILQGCAIFKKCISYFSIDINDPTNYCYERKIRLEIIQSES